MSSAGKCLTELSSAATVLEVQSQLQEPARLVDLKKSLAMSLSHMIKTIREPLTGATSAELLKAILCSPFEAEQKRVLSDDVHAKLAGSSITDRLEGQEQQTFQKGRSLLQYLTKRDWETLSDKSEAFDAPSKCMVFVNRFAKGGMVKPSCIARAQMVAVSAALQLNEPHTTPVAAYYMVHELRNVWPPENEAMYELPLLRVWPETAAELPNAIYKAMYTDDDPPISMKLDSLPRARAMVSCRDTNKNVRGIIEPRPKKAPRQSTALVDAPASSRSALCSPVQIFQAATDLGLSREDAMEWCMHGVKLLHQARHQSHGGPSTPQKEANVQILPPKAGAELSAKLASPSERTSSSSSLCVDSRSAVSDQETAAAPPHLPVAADPPAQPAGAPLHDPSTTVAAALEGFQPSVRQPTDAAALEEQARVEAEHQLLLQKAEDDKAKKKPRACTTKKRPAAAAITKNGARPVPDATGKPVHYKNGVVYTGANVWQFKVDTRKDKKQSHSWGPDGSKKMEAWDMVMRALEAGSP